MQISIRVGVVQAMVFPLELTKPVRGTKGSSGSILAQSPKMSKFSESATPGAGTLPAGFAQTFNDFEVDNTEPNGPWSSSSFPLTRRSFRNSGCRSCSMGIDHLHRIQSAVDAPMASIATSEFLHFLLRNPWAGLAQSLDPQAGSAVCSPRRYSRNTEPVAGLQRRPDQAEEAKS